MKRIRTGNITMVAAAAVVAVGKTVNLKTDIPHTMNKYSISQGLIKEIGPHFPSSMSGKFYTQLTLTSLDVSMHNTTSYIFYINNQVFIHSMAYANCLTCLIWKLIDFISTALFCSLACLVHHPKKNVTAAEFTFIKAFPTNAFQIKAMWVLSFFSSCT